MLGVAIIVAAKVLGTALVGRLFVLVEPQLMTFAWFVRCAAWWRAHPRPGRPRLATIVRLARRSAAAPGLARIAAPARRLHPLTPCDPASSCRRRSRPTASSPCRRQRRATSRCCACSRARRVLLFNGSDGAEWPAEIVRIGRMRSTSGSARALPVERELPWAVTLAIGVPANDRMDALVEKAGELGAHAIQPLVCERSVLRLSGERAEARRRHWSGVAAAASEQCGRAPRHRDPAAAVAGGVARRSAAADPGAARRLVLSLDAEAVALPVRCDDSPATGEAPRSSS